MVQFPNTIHDSDKLTENSKEPKCILRVTGSQPRQFGNWYQIWEAAAAVTAMCVRQGKGGTWEGLGKLRSSGDSRFFVADIFPGAAQTLVVEVGKAERPFVEAE